MQIVCVCVCGGQTGSSSREIESKSQANVKNI